LLRLSEKVVRAVALCTLTGAVLGLDMTPAATASTGVTITKTTYFTLVCQAGILGTLSLPHSMVTASYPASVQHGATFSTTIAGYANVNTATANKAYTLGARYYDGTITTDNIFITDATPQTYNLANPPMAIPRAPLPNKAFKLKLPPKGVLTTHLTAGKPGKVTGTDGNAVAKFNLYNSGGVRFLSLTLTCQPPTPPLTVVATTVS
jgi:hypothetical protein